MDSLWYMLKREFLTVFADIKISSGPLWIVYQPHVFRVTGSETRRIASMVKPGDIVMRACANRIHKYFIPRGKSDCNHSGLYVGNGKVIHAIARGVEEIDLIDFCRTDRMVVLRPASGHSYAVNHARICAKRNVPYDFDLTMMPNQASIIVISSPHPVFHV